MVMTQGWFIALPTLHRGVSYFSSPTGPPKNTRPFERLVDWRRIAVFLRNDEVGGAETYMVAYWYYMVIECYRYTYDSHMYIYTKIYSSVVLITHFLKNMFLHKAPRKRLSANGGGDGLGHWSGGRCTGDSEKHYGRGAVISSPRGLWASFFVKNHIFWWQEQHSETFQFRIVWLQHRFWEVVRIFYFLWGSFFREVLQCRSLKFRPSNGGDLPGLSRDASGGGSRPSALDAWIHDHPWRSMMI